MVIRKKILLISHIFFFFLKISNAVDILTLQGIVCAAKDSIPLQYVNIQIKNTSFGTITNIQGEFEFMYYTRNKNDTIVFSTIGFKTKEIPTREIINFMEFHVYMEQFIYQLSAVNIFALSPYDVIKEAKIKIPSNYYLHPIILSAYYKQTVKENDNFIQFGEAIMNVFIPNYQDFRKTKKGDYTRKINLLESRVSDDLSTSGFHYLQSPYIVLYTHLLITPLDSNSYKYVFINDSLQLNNDVYIIQLIPQNYDNARLMFTFFIDKTSFVVKKVIQSVPQIVFEKFNHIFTHRDKKNESTSCLQHHEITYHFFEVENKWHLKYIKDQQIQMIQFDSASTAYKMESISEILVNKIQIENVKEFKKKEILKQNIDLYNFKQDYNEDFWKISNTIKETPEEMKMRADLEKEKSLEEQFKNIK